MTAPRVNNWGVTRGVGQGNGLAGAHDIIEKNDGVFVVRSGDAEFSLGPAGRRHYASISPLAGTGVLFRMRTDNPVDLTETFIGSNDQWTWLDQECERVSEAGGLMVRTQCDNLGSRAPALRLRRKIKSLLDASDEPLVLDFEGISTTASSFLDELLGRLAVELGPQVFKRRVKIANMSQLVGQMAGVVIVTTGVGGIQFDRNHRDPLIHPVARRRFFALTTPRSKTRRMTRLGTRIPSLLVEGHGHLQPYGIGYPASLHGEQVQAAARLLRCAAALRVTCSPLRL